ncbi:MAG: heme exporter protein CcmD [Exilibacterium sp.]
MSFQFNSLSEFWYMAGHGPYVWGCYLVTAMLLIYLVVMPLMRHRRFLKQQGRQRRLRERNVKSDVLRSAAAGD